MSIYDHKEMCSRNKTGWYYGEMSCITIWRTLCRRQDSLENSPIRIYWSTLFKEYFEWVKHYDENGKLKQKK